MGIKIIIHLARCNKCGDLLLSEEEEKKLVCQCGNLTVWGGKKQTNRKWESDEDPKVAFTDMSIVSDEDISEENIRYLVRTLFNNITELLAEGSKKQEKNKSRMISAGVKGSMSIQQVKGKAQK